MAERIVIAGASLGGLRAAEQLRAAGWQGEIIVIGDEHHLPYNRPPLSKDVLATRGSTNDALATLTFRPRRTATDIQWRLGSGIVRADLAARTLETLGGETYHYDGLVIATGLRPARVPAPGPMAGRHVVRTIEDTIALSVELEPGARVVVVGAGFIGCEIAATASSLGCQVTLVEGSSGPMEGSLGTAMSSGVRNLLNERGITTLSGTRVIEFLGAGLEPGRCTSIMLADGTRLEADVVVEAVGSRANVEWLEGNGLDLSDGIECDGQLRVLGMDGRPLDNVVAVGDIARFPDARNGYPARRVEHWATPTDTAKIAAPALIAALRGQEPAEMKPPLPSFWTDLFKIRIQGVGTTALAEHTKVFEGDPERPELGVAIGYYRAGRLVGAVTSGLPAPKQLHYRQAVLDATSPAAMAIA